MINTYDNEAVKDLQSELLNDLNDATDPSEAIGSLWATLEEVGEGNRKLSFENATELPSDFREQFHYLTLEPVDSVPEAEALSQWSPVSIYTGNFDELAEYADAQANGVGMFTNSNTDYWFDVSDYANNNEGKHWIFIPNKHRDGTRGVRKATKSDAKRAYQVAYKLTIIHFISLVKE